MSPLPHPRPLFFMLPISLKVFGCICIDHVDKLRGSKFDPKALKCIFLDMHLAKELQVLSSSYQAAFCIYGCHLS